jgi:hypothetical protein
MSKMVSYKMDPMGVLFFVAVKKIAANMRRPV